MAELSKTNLAHVSAFMFLSMHGQSVRPFVSTGGADGMGSQKMSDLTWFNSAASQEILKANAALISHQLINFVATFYTQQREAAFANRSLPELIDTLIALLVDPAKTVLQLADRLDSIFVYKNEATAAVPVARMAANHRISPQVRKRLGKSGIKV